MIKKIEEFSEAHSRLVCSPILLITGAVGAFGAVLKATPIGGISDVIGLRLVWYPLSIYVAAALKSAQGSSTVALVATFGFGCAYVGDALV